MIPVELPGIELPGPKSWAAPALALGANIKVNRGELKQTAVLARTKTKISPSLYSRLEKGDIRVDKPFLVNQLLDALGVQDPAYRKYLQRLAVSASHEGWASAHRSKNREAIPETMVRLTSLEESTSDLFVVEMHAIPGVLQTDAYRDLITRKTLTASQRIQKLAEAIIEVRGERQRRFMERPPSSSVFFIRQGVLYAHFGEPAVLVSQLEALLGYIQDRTSPIGIRVITERAPLVVAISSLARLVFEPGPFTVPDVFYKEVGARAEFHRGPLHGERAEDDYTDLQDVVDTVIQEAPGYLASRRLIEEALEDTRRLL